VSTSTAISRHGVTLPMDHVAEFCRNWKIQELSLLGSYLRDDFRPHSDFDFLYTFADGAGWTLFDLVALDHELVAIVGRFVDLVDCRMIERS
jgi:uncharacterized protein